MNYSVKPQEHELRKAREIVESSIESAKHFLEKEEDLTFHLGHASEVEADEFGAFGTAQNSGNARIYFNASVEDWGENLEDLAVDVYGKAWFYEKVDISLVWQQLLASITGLMLIERASETRKIKSEDLGEEWREKKETLSGELTPENQERFSWQLKLVLGRKLLEDHDLENLPELSRSELIETGDQLFSD